jgi:restriction endonuclease Mrr
MQALNAETVKQFISNVDAEGFSFSIAVNKTFTTCGDGYWSNVVKDVFVTSIGMYISTVNDEGYFGDGDLAVNYTEATWDNNVDGLIYTDSLFLQQVKQFLIDNGFNAEAVNDISYSEQGMQDDERVSCDAYAFADYVRNVLQVTA